MRKVKFEDNKIFHIFNRGIDGRDIFMDSYDQGRFFRCMDQFNDVKNIGSLYEASFREGDDRRIIPDSDRLIEFFCYCLNPNHLHFLSKQIKNGGISKFMHKLGAGYTRYYNEKYRRRGGLFEGPFKAVEVDSDEYLLHLSAYINLNDKVHRLGNRATKSSWGEYCGNFSEGICNTNLVLNQFNDRRHYQEFAKAALATIQDKKDMQKLILEEL